MDGWHRGTQETAVQATGFDGDQKAWMKHEQVLCRYVPRTLSSLRLTSTNQFGESSESEAEVNDNDDFLPFPKPLSRASFVTPNFDPATFLSSLSNRHQSLADLQTELRELSQSLSKELLDLVNENYQDFLSLGTALKGGEEKIEEIKTVLLGFQRDVRGIKEKFESRTATMKQHLDEKRLLRSNIAVGYDLLQINEILEILEQKLLIYQGNKDMTTNGAQEFDEELSDEEDDEEVEGSDGILPASLRRLERRIQQYLSMKLIIRRVGETHPYVAGQESRIATIKTALLLDLSAATKQAETSGTQRDAHLLKLLHLYEILGEETQAIMTLLKMRI